MKGETVYVLDGWDDDKGAVVEVFADKTEAQKRAKQLQEKTPGLYLGVVKRKVK